MNINAAYNNEKLNIKFTQLKKPLHAIKKSKSSQYSTNLTNQAIKTKV